MQQVHDPSVHFRILFLKFIRDFANLKLFGSLFHRSAPLNSVVFNAYVFVLHWFSSSSCVFLQVIWVSLLVKIISCERGTYIVETFIYFNHQNLEILCIDFLFPT